MNKRKFPITNIGSVSLMMIFIVLCMVTFAVLSLATATADYRFSEKRATHTTQYYAASNKAEEKLAQIDSILTTVYEQNTGAENYYTKINESLKNLEEIVFTEEGDIRYLVTMNDSQAILVQLHICAPEEIQENKSSSLYRITCWKEIQTRDWEGDNSVQLIDQNF